METFQGESVSSGYADGRAVVFRPRQGAFSRRRISQESVEHEIERLEAALGATLDDLESTREQLSSEVGVNQAAVFDAHRAILADGHLQSRIRAQILDARVNAEWAVETAMEAVAQQLQSVGDSYLAERADDVRDLCVRLLSHFPGGRERELPTLPPDTVLVAHQLLPSDTVRLDRQRVRAIVVERCGRTSHVAILAKALGIPAVSGLPGIAERIPGGAHILVDGVAGEVIVHPEEGAAKRFEEARRAFDDAAAQARKKATRRCTTRDGVHVTLLGNLGRVDEALDVRAHQLEGVGLFRTEALFLDHHAPPTFEQHRDAYREAAQKLDGLPLVIRVMDLGGDKRPAFLAPSAGHNPNLGLRGLRLALKELGLLRTQLRAILDVAQDHPIEVMFPMVLAGDDFQTATGVLRSVASESGYGRIPPLGAMIETPAALFALDEILRTADFLSIGSNDLTQFILAADRDDVELMDDYSILHPSVLRAVHQVVEAAARAGKPLSLCGEAAGDPVLVPVLVGLGLRRLSMSPSRSLAVRARIQSLSMGDADELARGLLGARSLAEARSRAVEWPPAGG